MIKNTTILKLFFILSSISNLTATINNINLINEA